MRFDPFVNSRFHQFSSSVLDFFQDLYNKFKPRRGFAALSASTTGSLAVNDETLLQQSNDDDFSVGNTADDLSPSSAVIRTQSSISPVVDVTHVMIKAVGDALTYPLLVIGTRLCVYEGPEPISKYTEA